MSTANLLWPWEEIAFKTYVRDYGKVEVYIKMKYLYDTPPTYIYDLVDIPIKIDTLKVRIEDKNVPVPQYIYQDLHGPVL